MEWHDLVVERAPCFGEIKMFSAALWHPADQSTRLHAIQQLRDIPLSDKQTLCQVQLRDSFGGSDVRQDIELGVTELPGSELRRGSLQDTMADPQQMQPRDH